MAKLTAAKPSSDYDWECEEDLRTLIRAKEIEKDAKRLEKARALAKKKMLDVAAVAGEADSK
jgi:hypothetical protein